MTRGVFDTDVLGTQAARSGLFTRIGGVSVDTAVFGGQITSAMNDLPSATVDLNAVLLAGDPIDYFGTVELGQRFAGVERADFTGNVVDARHEDAALRLKCQTHPGLRESTVGPLELLGVSPQETMHLLTRSGGLAEDQVGIPDLDELPLETMEVLVPLSGMSVDRPVRLGQLTFIDPVETAPLFRGFTNDDMLIEFQSAECHALYRCVQRRLIDAESEALSLIDVTLAWFQTRARYGLAFMPSGHAQTFSRRLALARPRRIALALARGIESQRAWMRSPSAEPFQGNLPVGAADPHWVPPDPQALSTSEQQAIRAVARAASESDVLQRIQALWEAIEFYVEGVRPRARYSNAEARRIRRSIPKDVSPAIRERALELLARINDAPLMAKVREAVARDGVPITESEMDLLSRVRKVRNDAVHGRSADTPTTEDVDFAVSVVSRLVLHRLYRGRR